MEKSNAQRQQEYREKQKEHDAEKRRIDMYVNLHAKLAIEKLARHYEMSKIEVFEKIVLGHESSLTRKMDDEDFKNYHQPT